MKADQVSAGQEPERREPLPDCQADASAPPPDGTEHVECCPFCSEPYETGEAPEGYEWYCTSCKETLPDAADIERNISISHRFALAGLLLLVPAFSLTMLSVEQFGVRTDAGLVQGVITLIKSGEYFLGAVIGILSGVLPCLKLMGLCILTSRRFVTIGQHRIIHRLVEFSGRWGMIDVFLAAVMIYAFKFSAMFEITPKPGIVAFTAMVLCTLLSSWFFDTRIFRRHFHAGRK